MAELWSTIKSCQNDIPLPCDCTLCCLEPTTDNKKCRIYTLDDVMSLGPRYEQLLLCKSDGSEVNVKEDFEKAQKHVKWQLATMDYLWKMIGSTFQCINWRSDTPWETPSDSYQGDLIRYILTLTEDSYDIADTSAKLKDFALECRERFVNSNLSLKDRRHRVLNPCPRPWLAQISTWMKSLPAPYGVLLDFDKWKYTFSPPREVEFKNNLEKKQFATKYGVKTLEEQVLTTPKGIKSNENLFRISYPMPKPRATHWIKRSGCLEREGKEGGALEVLKQDIAPQLLERLLRPEKVSELKSHGNLIGLMADTNGILDRYDLLPKIFQCLNETAMNAIEEYVHLCPQGIKDGIWRDCQELHPPLMHHVVPSRGGKARHLTFMMCALNYLASHAQKYLITGTRNMPTSAEAKEASPRWVSALNKVVACRQRNVDGLPIIHSGDLDGCTNHYMPEVSQSAIERVILAHDKKGEFEEQVRKVSQVALGRFNICITDPRLDFIRDQSHPADAIEAVKDLNTKWNQLLVSQLYSVRGIRYTYEDGERCLLRQTVGQHMGSQLSFTVMGVMTQAVYDGVEPEEAIYSNDDREIRQLFNALGKEQNRIQDLGEEKQRASMTYIFGLTDSGDYSHSEEQRKKNLKNFFLFLKKVDEFKFHNQVGLKHRVTYLGLNSAIANLYKGTAEADHSGTIEYKWYHAAKRDPSGNFYGGTAGAKLNHFEKEELAKLYAATADEVVTEYYNPVRNEYLSVAEYNRRANAKNRRMAHLPGKKDDWAKTETTRKGPIMFVLVEFIIKQIPHIMYRSDTQLMSGEIDARGIPDGDYLVHSMTLERRVTISQGKVAEKSAPAFLPRELYVWAEGDDQLGLSWKMSKIDKFRNDVVTKYNQVYNRKADYLSNSGGVIAERLFTFDHRSWRFYPEVYVKIKQLVSESEPNVSSAWMDKTTSTRSQLLQEFAHQTSSMSRLDLYRKIENAERILYEWNKLSIDYMIENSIDPRLPRNLGGYEVWPGAGHKRNWNSVTTDHLKNITFLMRYVPEAVPVYLKRIGKLTNRTRVTKTGRAPRLYRDGEYLVPRKAFKEALHHALGFIDMLCTKVETETRHYVEITESVRSYVTLIRKTCLDICSNDNKDYKSPDVILHDHISRMIELPKLKSKRFRNIDFIEVYPHYDPKMIVDATLKVYKLYQLYYTSRNWTPTLVRRECNSYDWFLCQQAVDFDPRKIGISYTDYRDYLVLQAQSDDFSKRISEERGTSADIKIDRSTAKSTKNSLTDMYDENLAWAQVGYPVSKTSVEALREIDNL